MNIEAGDQVRVTISGDDAEWVKQVRETVQDALEPDMVLLASGRNEPANDFSATLILISFLVAVSAELTADGLRATIARAIKNHQGKRKALEASPVATEIPATPDGRGGKADVLVTVSAEGVIEVTIKQQR